MAEFAPESAKVDLRASAPFGAKLLDALAPRNRYQGYVQFSHGSRLRRWKVVGLPMSALLHVIGGRRHGLCHLTAFYVPGA